LGVRRVRHQHPRRAAAVPRCPPPHPGPRRGSGQAVQGLRRPQPALDRLRPQRRLAATRRPGHHPDRLAAPPRTRRPTGKSLHQDTAVSDPVRPRPPDHPRPTQDPQNPTRLAMGPRPGHSLATTASPAPQLMREFLPSRPPRSTPADPWKPAPTRAPSGTRHAHHRPYRAK
jgi:hypothetical protein